METQDPQGKVVRIRLAKGQAEAALIKSGDDFAVYAGDENGRPTLKKGDTLQIDGDSAGIRFQVEDGSFTPRIRVNTNEPLLVDGSFRIAKESAQIALVDATPVDVFKISGLDAKSTVKVKDVPPNMPEKGMNHTVKFSPLKLLEQDKSGDELPVGSKTFEYTTEGKKRVAIVENIGGRIDFVNLRDGNKQLFTFFGGDDVGTSGKRYNQGWNTAMSEIEAIMSVNNMSEAKFDAKKEDLGIPQNQLRGEVKVEYSSDINPNLPAFVGMSPADYLDRPAQVSKEAKEAKEAVKNVIKTVDYFYKEYPRVVNGEFAQLENKAGGKNPGKDLGDLMTQAKEAAENVFHEKNGAIRKSQLEKLYTAIDGVEKKAGEMQKLYKTDDKRKPYQRAAEAAKEAKYEFPQLRQALNAVDDVSQRKLRARSEGRKIGKLQSLVPVGMPKLAMEDAARLPEAMESQLPSILDFLKGKDGKGAA